MHDIDRSTRTAATDEDGADHIGSDTPRSGVATPQPDLQDRRLPGIMSYFGQVGQDPCPSNSSPSDAAVPLNLKRKHQAQRGPVESSRDRSRASLVASPTSSSLPLYSNRAHDPETLHRQPQPAASPPYPTPPASQPSSSGSSLTRDTAALLGGQEGRAAVTASPPRSDMKPLEPSGRPSEPAISNAQVPMTCPEAVTAAVRGDCCVLSQTHPKNDLSKSLPATTAAVSSSKWFSLDGLRELTRGVMFKSGPPTPTRALSAARSSLSEGKEPSGRSSNDGAEPSGISTPRGSAGAQAPASKGKLTIKIAEGRGLRKSRDPYVVAVFQRSELISSGPRSVAEDDNLAAPTSSLGGVPIQRQGSDSGRPMAIPMRSRQSSNTSITDYNTFRSRTARLPCTNPTWDAQAVFDVVDSNMLVDISVYDHTASGEEFLGHVDFQASRDNDTPVKGWFSLKGHADTMVENTPTGEIYVEAWFQRSEKKHFGPSDFEILKLIGKGTFGQVYQVRKRDTQRIYAMKVLQKKVIVQKKEVAHTVGERNILVRTAMSDSPFIVGLKFSFQTPSELYLVTDYMSGGELFWHLQKEGRFNERRAKFYIAELILAIQHLHNNDIVYRDLKPENILLDANGHIALCDFGLSKANLTKNATTNTFCGTTEYLAPEVLLDESGYTKMVDFWSLGVLVFEMCCGWSPFYAEDTQQMYKNIAFGKVRFPRDTLSQEGRNFVKGLLNRNPKHRLGATDDAEELKRHPFFGDIDWDLLAKKLITPPFKPKLKSETDVSYFDPEFTNALDQNGSLNERAAALAQGFAASTPLSPSVQANFQGFTFVDESALDDHMGDRFRSDDEEMGDAHARHEDDEWDNLDDFDMRKTANRMSGIVKTSTADEHMVGGSHFDV